MDSSINILGIDYGFANTGFAIVKLKNNIIIPLKIDTINTTPSPKYLKMYKEDDNIIRIQKIVKELEVLIDGYAVQIVTLEQFTTNMNNTNTSRKLYGVVGAIAALSKLKNIPLIGVTPRQIKLVICNKPSGTKEEVMESIKKNYPEIKNFLPHQKYKIEHCYDAFASIITALEEYDVWSHI